MSKAIRNSQFSLEQLCSHKFEVIKAKADENVVLRDCELRVSPPTKIISKAHSPIDCENEILNEIEK